VITEERAVELVDALLVMKRQAYPACPELAVSGVEGHAVGWLVFWQSAAYLRSGNVYDLLVGNGPYLLDRQDGSIHQIPVPTLGENWEELYLEQVKGITPPDALLGAVRDVLSRDGRVAAIRHLRKHAPQLSMQDAKAYVDAVRHGGQPAEELIDRTRERPARVPLPIATLTGPLDEPPRM
jgi:hypothetical protein